MSSYLKNLKKVISCFDSKDNDAQPKDIIYVEKMPEHGLRSNFVSGLLGQKGQTIADSNINIADIQINSTIVLLTYYTYIFTYIYTIYCSQ